MKFLHQSRAITLLKSSGKFHVLVIILHTQNPSICSQDIKWKQNSDITLGP